MAEPIKDVIKQEYIKCAKNPAYFMKKYCMIQHPIRGKIPFELYDFQDRVVGEFAKERFNIILKARQLGISTLTAGYSLWMMTFQQDKNILVIATKQEVAKNLVTKVRVMHANLPSWLKQRCVEDNKLNLRYRNGSQIKAVSSGPEAARSEALSLLILDEAAFIDKIDDIWTAAQSTLTTGGQCIALSTPNGVGNWFHKNWVEAEEGRGMFNPIKLHWTVHPDREQEWRDEQNVLLGPGSAAQECDCDFLTSGTGVIDAVLLERLRERSVKDPIEKRGIDSNCWVWEPANYSKDYIVCADVGRGDSADYSAFHVIDIETLEQVAEYKGRLSTKDFGNMLVSIATEYNDAILIVENNNIGWATIQQIIDRDYPNLFYTSKDLQYVDVQHQMNNRINRQERSMVAGFSTTSKTRPLIISKLEEFFREESVVVHSNRLIDELQTFVYINNRAEAMRGYNDDLVMSFAIGLWVRDTALRLKTEGVELTKKTLTRMMDNDGLYNSNEPNRNDSWEWETGQNKEKESLEWLL
jgi:hypothetical protein